MIYFIVISALILAYSNGANDNFKGVATLFGTGTTNYRKAIIWATATTALGSLASLFLADTLIKNFSGKGLVTDSVAMAPEFAVAVALGAALTVILATNIGMPISTTHSLIGALTGSGLVAVGLDFNFQKLGATFFLPLIVSPVLAAVLCTGAYMVFRKGRETAGITKTTCACIGEARPVYTLQTNSQLTMDHPSGRLEINVNSSENCREIYAGTFIGVNAQTLLDTAHFMTAGVVSFARGLNDTPKMAGLLLLVGALNIGYDVALIAMAIAVGGWLNARKVAETMSKKITPMNDGQGFTANLITSLLVTTASFNGLPVSTTHVSVGSLFGIGAVTGSANWKVIREIGLSWVLTLPVAALAGAVIYWIIIFIRF